MKQNGVEEIQRKNKIPCHRQHLWCYSVRKGEKVY